MKKQSVKTSGKTTQNPTTNSSDGDEGGAA
jgi:hypothetical protein